MKAFYYISRVLLYISMIIFGFLNILSWFALTFRLRYPAMGWILIASLAVCYPCVLVFLHLKKFVPMFISSFIFPVVSLVVGSVLMTSARGNIDFNVTFWRNHAATLLICLFTGLIWAFYRAAPEQRAKRRERDYRRLSPEEKIL